MKRLKRYMNLQKYRNKKILIIVIVLQTIAPLIINIGLMFTDVIYSKMGIDLTAHKEVDYLSITMRPKFNRYYKCYINLRKKHASELRNVGSIKYVKENNTNE